MTKKNKNLQNRVAMAAVAYSMVVAVGCIFVAQMPEAKSNVELITRTLVLGGIFAIIGASVWYITLKDSQ